MKKIILFSILIFGYAFTTTAQVNLDRQIRVYDSLNVLTGKGKLVSINEHALIIEKDDKIDTIEMKNVDILKLGNRWGKRWV